MIPADPTQPRQLSDHDPILLWRDQSAGGREGLAIVPSSCSRPNCPCRDVMIEVLAVDDGLLGMSMTDTNVSTLVMGGAAEQGDLVLRAAVDVDTATVKADERGAPTPAGAAALSWLRAELSEGPLLSCLRRRFDIDKRLPVNPAPVWPFDWSRWQSGDRVCWEEVFPEMPIDFVQIGDEVVVVRDWYCANAGCPCTEVWVGATIVGESREPRYVGGFEIDYASGAMRKLRGETESDAATLAEVWAEIKSGRDVCRSYRRRHLAVQAAAAEGTGESSRRAAGGRPPRETSGAAVLEPARNAPCPCGSGLKYKRCCMRRTDP